jgi:hypothetical protein
VRRIERIVQRYRQLDRAQRRPRMSAHAGHRFQNVLSDFIGYGLQFVLPQPPQIGRRVNLFQQAHWAKL